MAVRRRAHLAALWNHSPLRDKGGQTSTKGCFGITSECPTTRELGGLLYLGLLRRFYPALDRSHFGLCVAGPA
jgi:hypothetical protein